MVQQTEHGPNTLYRIEPPRMEGRYVKGNFVQPVSEATPKSAAPEMQPERDTSDVTDASLDTADDPDGPAFIVNNGTNPPGFDFDSNTYVRPRNRGPGGDGFDPYIADGSARSAGHFERDRTQLRQLDEQLDAMLSARPAQWRLAEMEQAYRALQAAAAPGIADMIDARLAAIEARQPIHAEYDAFLAITKRTDQRDAELFALQNAVAAGIPASASAVQPISWPRRSPGDPFAQEAYEASAHKFPAADFDAFDGAGIVSRVRRPQPGVPPHILVAPDGRLLAYLQAGHGIDLDAWLGQSVGLVGPRTHQPQIQADLIQVTGLTPVRLQQ
jgi:hypothetical protein